MGINELGQFLKESLCAYTASKKIVSELQKQKFEPIIGSKRLSLKLGDSIYLHYDESAVIALKIGSQCRDLKYKIVATHIDSPTFKLKPNPNMVRNPYLVLNTEVYGGPIYYSWLDRPLGISGKVIYLKGGVTETFVGSLPQTVIIPSVAIGLNRDVNEGKKLNPQIDLLPVYSTTSGADFISDLSAFLGADKILSFDLALYSKETITIIGDGSLACAPRIDNLECTSAALEGFLAGIDESAINVLVCFNHEEIGSNTKQGADSPVLKDTLYRVALALGFDTEDFYVGLANSFFISADNGHAVHPHHPEKTDSGNAVYLNKGVVIKHNANQRYTTNVDSWGLITKYCLDNSIQYQNYTNRSDERGGSTLGCLNATQLNISSIDIGLPQLAMHACVEVVGVNDYLEMVKLLTSIYNK